LWNPFENVTYRYIVLVCAFMYGLFIHMQREERAERDSEGERVKYKEKQRGKEEK